MKEYYGNHLGLVINSSDPEYRGRVQIFIPHIMPALYEDWNKEGVDIQISCVGSNIPEGLSPEIHERLVKILPWAESASPIIGGSAPGNLFSSMLGGAAAGAATGGVAGALVGAATGAVNHFYNQSPTSNPAPGVTPTGNSVADSAIKAANEGWSSANQPGAGNLGCAAMVSKMFRSGTGQGIIGGTKDTVSTSELYSSLSKDTSRWAKIPIEQAGAGDVIVTSALYQGGVKKQSGHAGICIDPPDVPPDKRRFVSNSSSSAKVKQNYTVDSWNRTIAKRNPAQTHAFRYIGGSTGQPASSAPSSSGPESTGGSGAPAPASPQTNKEGIVGPAPTPQQGAIVPTEGAGQVAGTTSGGGTATTGLPRINPADVKEIGPTQTRNVSTYGSVFQDLTSYLDVLPEQRPPEATAYWRGQGVNLESQEAKLRKNLTNWKPSLKLQDTGKGAFLSGQGQGNLTPGFSIAVPSDNRYGLKPGQFVQIKNKAGQPIGPNNGYFQVADKGNSSQLGGKLNAIDYYYGNDPELKKYFTGLQGAAFDITPVDISGDSAAQLKQALSQQGNAALAGTTFTDTSGLATAPSGGTSVPSVINNTDSNGRTPVFNTNDMAKGMFAYPNPGAMVWVFFREGNPLYPVYFAASYSSGEWQSAYRGSSAGNLRDHDNPDKRIISSTNVSAQGGGLLFKSHISLTDPLENESVASFHNDQGSGLAMTNGCDFYRSSSNRRDEVDNDRHIVTRGYKEEWVQGDASTNTRGDAIIKIGNISQEAIDAMTELSNMSYEANQKLMNKPK